MVKIKLNLKDETVSFLNDMRVDHMRVEHTLSETTEMMIEYGKMFIYGEDNSTFKQVHKNCAHFCERCCMEEFRLEWCSEQSCNRKCDDHMCDNISKCLDTYCTEECEKFDYREEDMKRPLCVNIDCPNSKPVVDEECLCPHCQEQADGVRMFEYRGDEE